MERGPDEADIRPREHHSRTQRGKRRNDAQEFKRKQVVKERKFTK